MKKIFLTIILLIFAGNSFAEVVRLQWDANSESDLAGYKMYQNGIRVGDDIPAGTEEYTTPDLANGDYYWCLTAFNLGNSESDPSNTVSRTISEAPNPPQGLRFWQKVISWLKNHRPWYKGLKVGSI